MANVTEAEFKAMLARRRPRRPIAGASAEAAPRSVYTIVVPGAAPAKNAGRNPGTSGHRAKGTGAWREAFRWTAVAQLREQGLTAPLAGPVWLVVEERLLQGRRDAAAGLAEIQDAMEGALYVNDRQVVRVETGRDNHADACEVAVWACLTAADYAATVVERATLAAEREPGRKA